MLSLEPFFSDILGIERKLRDICLELAGPPTPVLGRKGRTHDSFILVFDYWRF